MKTKKIKPDYFIEMYVGTYSKKIYQYCYPISIFDHALKTTKEASNLKTIAIFKIKLKNV